MKPVDQTRFGKPHGNCLAASMASIFETSLEVFDFVFPVDITEEEMDQWWDHRHKYLRDTLAELYGVYPIYLQIGDTMPSGFHLINGINKRGIGHTVVGKDGKMVHDPNSLYRDGLDSEYEWVVFVPFNPADCFKGKKDNND